MCKILLPLLIVFLSSCSNEKPDCSICEEKLRSIMMSMPTPIDLPKEIEKPVSTGPKENQITAIVYKNNTYGFDDDPTQYAFDEYKEKLGEKMNEAAVKITTIKIAGHKFAHYEAVFQVLAFCQANQLDPVLAYDE